MPKTPADSATPRPPACAGPASASPSAPSKSRPAAPFHGFEAPFSPADRDFPSARRKITPPDALSRRESSHRTPPATRRATPPLRPRGEVAEWLNAPHSKCGIGASLSGVRIPPSPPVLAAQIVPDSLPLSGRIRRTACGRAPRDQTDVRTSRASARAVDAMGSNRSLMLSAEIAALTKSGFNRSMARSVLATSSGWSLSAPTMALRSCFAATAISKISRGLMVAPR